ncbi:unnamed protein product [Prunus brigantina]
MLWGGGPAYGVKSILSKKKYLNINLIDIIDFITFITIFLNKFLDNKPKGFLVDDSDDIDDSDDRDFDRELELLTMMNALTMDMMP